MFPLKRCKCGAMPDFSELVTLRWGGGVTHRIVVVCGSCGKVSREVDHYYDESCDTYLPSHYADAADNWNYETRSPVTFPQLLPCPCCGGAAEFYADEDSEGWENWLALSCTDCGLTLDPDHGALNADLEYYPQWDYDDLAKRWNRRV